MYLYYLPASSTYDEKIVLVQFNQLQKGPHFQKYNEKFDEFVFSTKSQWFCVFSGKTSSFDA